MTHHAIVPLSPAETQAKAQSLAAESVTAITIELPASAIALLTPDPADQKIQIEYALISILYKHSAWDVMPVLGQANGPWQPAPYAIRA
jgi:hypothetical protein